jgi:hypothetical protein
MVIQATDATKWPTGGSYRAVICTDPNNGPWELVAVTGGQGTQNLVVTRAAESYNGVQTAQAWPSGAYVAAVLTHDGLSATFATSGGGSALLHEEFLPANAATTVTTSQTPTGISFVSRAGVIQSTVDGHYTVAGAVLTFSTAFSGSERVIVSYLTGQAGSQGPPGPNTGFHDEFVPTAGATSVSLTQQPSTLLVVARGSVVQSSAAGDYSLVGNNLSFTDAFDGVERLVVSYISTTYSAPAGAGVADTAVRTYLQRVMGTIDPGGPPLSTPTLSGTATASGGWASAPTIGQFATPTGAGHFYIAIAITATTGTVAQGLELHVVNVDTSGDLLAVQVQPSGSTVGYQQSWSVTVPGGTSAVRLVAGVWNAGSNTGTITFTWQGSWTA